MGMPVTAYVVDDTANRETLGAVFNDFTLLDRTFSPYVVDSAVSRINRGELRLEEAGPLVNQAVDLCGHYERATEGYFSAWINGRFDPSGLIKGWAIDRACSILDRNGFRDYFVDAGGVKDRTFPGVEKRIVFENAHCGFGRIQRGTAMLQNFPPGAERILQTGAILTFALRRHFVAFHGSSAAVDHQSDFVFLP